MKHLVIPAIAAITLIMVGCATSSYSVGKNFESTNVNKIMKGKTTKAEIVSLFGQPFSKSVISSTGEKWIYTYSAGTASAQSYVVTTKVETTGTQKTLDILIENDIVTNYTYTEGPMPNTSVY